MDSNKILYISKIYKDHIIHRSSNSKLMIYLVLFAFVILFVYYFIDVNRKNILLDWENNRCNPKYMFISGYIKNDTDNNIQYTYDNFLECTNRNERIKETKKIIHKTDKSMFETIDKLYDIEQTTENSASDIINSQINDISINYLNVENNKKNVYNKMDLLYDQHKKIYNITEMYINRFIFVIDYIFKYISNVFEYNLYNYKSQFNAAFNRKNTAIRNSYISKIAQIQLSFDKYNLKDFDSAYTSANSALNKLVQLTNDMDEFESNNLSTTNKINNTCDIMKNNSKLVTSTNSCGIIFPNYPTNLY